MNWRLSHRFSREALELADRHYSRQKIGTNQFMPPGKTLVFMASGESGKALWGTSWQFYPSHAFGQSWNCCIFRNESELRGKVLIRSAVAATSYLWGPDNIPEGGFLTFINPDKVRAKSDPGHVFIMAGFRYAGRTQSSGLLAFRLEPRRFPSPAPPLGANLELKL